MAAAGKGVPERIGWAVEQLAVEQDEEILEVGCGPGVLTLLICERLKNGSLTAIDRSPMPSPPRRPATGSPWSSAK